jgi:hypothetical protein
MGRSGLREHRRLGRALPDAKDLRRGSSTVQFEACHLQGLDPSVPIGVGIEAMPTLSARDVLNQVAIDAHEFRVVGGVAEIEGGEVSPHPLAALPRIVLVQ